MVFGVLLVSHVFDVYASKAAHATLRVPRALTIANGIEGKSRRILGAEGFAIQLVIIFAITCYLDSKSDPSHHTVGACYCHVHTPLW